MSRERFSRAEDDVIRAGRTATPKRTLREIAEQLGRKTDSVSTRASFLGLVDPVRSEKLRAGKAKVRASRAGEFTKPGAEVRQPGTRRCLRCQAGFTPATRWIFVCSPCKGDSTWRAGV